MVSYWTLFFFTTCILGCTLFFLKKKKKENCIVLFLGIFDSCFLPIWSLGYESQWTRFEDAEYSTSQNLSHCIFWCCMGFVVGDLLGGFGDFSKLIVDLLWCMWVFLILLPFHYYLCITKWFVLNFGCRCIMLALLTQKIWMLFLGRENTQA